MAKHRKKIPDTTKRALIDQAGGKCANPGCLHTLLELHHIKHWAVFQSDEPSHMIAICSVCHDQVHRGTLKIEDETLYAWKRIIRHNSGAVQGHLDVEIAERSIVKIHLGPIAVAAPLNSELFVFRLANGAYLKFDTIDHELLLLSCKIIDSNRREIIRVNQNHARHQGESGVRWNSRAGRMLLEVRDDGRYISENLLREIFYEAPLIREPGWITVLDIETVGPGEISVLGAWVGQEGMILSTPAALTFFRAGSPTPVSFCSSDPSAESPPTLMVMNEVPGVPLFSFDESGILKIRAPTYSSQT